MNEQVLSPAIEKALADLRQAIIDQLQAGAPTATISAVQPPVAPVTPIDQAGQLPTAPVTPPPAPAADISLPGLNVSAAPEFPPAPPAPAPQAESINLPDLGASTDKVTDLSGTAPIAPPSLAANNGLDDSAPILPPVGGPDLSAPVDLTAPMSTPVAPAMEPTPISPISAAPEVPAPENPTINPVAPAAPAAPTGLPKANSLLSSVLKKGWNSNQ